MTINTGPGSATGGRDSGLADASTGGALGSGGSEATGGTSGTATAGGATATGGARSSTGGVSATGGANNSTGGDTTTGGANHVDCASEVTAANVRVISVAADGQLGNRTSSRPFLSADGNTVMFESYASNLVPNDTADTSDVFAYNTVTGTLVRVSVDSLGNPCSGWAATLSSDACRIAFLTDGTHFGLNTGANAIALTNSSQNPFVLGMSIVTPASITGDVMNPVLSGDASLLVYTASSDNIVPGDTNGRRDFFAYQPAKGTTERLIVGNDDPQFSIDNFVPSMASDGSTLAFCGHYGIQKSYQPNVAVLNLKSNTMQWAGVTPSGSLSSKACWAPVLSADGNTVAFVGQADDLVAGDTNETTDTFIRDLNTQTTVRIGPDARGSSVVGLSGDGYRAIAQRGDSTVANANSPNDGIVFYDRRCETSRVITIASDLGQLGTSLQLSEISVNRDGTAFAATVRNNAAPDYVQQIVLIELQWSPSSP